MTVVDLFLRQVDKKAIGATEVQQLNPDGSE